MTEIQVMLTNWMTGASISPICARNTPAMAMVSSARSVTLREHYGRCCGSTLISLWMRLRCSSQSQIPL